MTWIATSPITQELRAILDEVIAGYPDEYKPVREVVSRSNECFY